MPHATILLIRPWIEDFSAFDHFAQPLGFLVLAQQLLDIGLHVHYVDCLALASDPNVSPHSTLDAPAHLRLTHFESERIEKPAIFHQVPRYYRRFGASPDFIAQQLAACERPIAALITTGMTYWYRPLNDLIGMLDAIHPGIPIGLGGIYTTILPEHARRLFPRTKVFQGCPTSEFWNWLQSLSGPFREDVSSDPVPAWNLTRSTGYAALATSHGCMHRCDYCVASAMTPRWHPRAISAVQHEVDVLVNHLGYRHIALYDDDLGCGTRAGLDHFRSILELLKTYSPHVHWHTPNALGVSAVTREIAGLMKAAGFEQPRLSLHHLDRHFGQTGLDDPALAAFSAAAEHLVQAGYDAETLSCYIIAGLPGQRLRGLDAACRQLLQMGIKPYLAQYSPIPGTPLGDRRLAQLGYRDDSDLLLTNKILSVYSHDGWSGEEYQAFAAELKQWRQSRRSEPFP